MTGCIDAAFTSCLSNLHPADKSNTTISDEGGVEVAQHCQDPWTDAHTLTLCFPPSSVIGQNGGLLYQESSGSVCFLETTGALPASGRSIMRNGQMDAKMGQWPAGGRYIALKLKFTSIKHSVCGEGVPSNLNNIACDTLKTHAVLGFIGTMNNASKLYDCLWNSGCIYSASVLLCPYHFNLSSSPEFVGFVEWVRVYISHYSCFVHA